MLEMNGSLKWTILLLAILMWIPVDAEAIPIDGAPRKQLQQDGEKRALISQRRKRRRRRPRRRPKPRPAPAPAPEEPAAAEPAPAPSADNLRRGGRVEFDGRLVQGQTAKSGAIYLFARQRTDLQSMVRERTDYRKEILRTVTSHWVKEK